MNWLLKILSMLPLRLLQLIGAGIGSLAFRLIPVLRNRTNEHLDLAGLNAPGLYARVGRNVGRQALESCWIWNRPADEVCRRVTVSEDAQRIIDEAVRSGRPLVFLTPHFGCFEVLPVWFAHTYHESLGKSIAVLFKPPKKAIIAKVVGESRQAPGVMACPTTIVGVKHVIKALRRGDAFGALPDQVPTAGDGVWADFFGRPAYTMTLPMRVAHQFDAIRIFAWTSREGHGWRLDAMLWDEPLTGDLKKDARSMNRMIEEIVRLRPEQYGWSYNRYKGGNAPRPDAE